MPPVADAGVSAIIPAYNYARYLPEAIASVLAQTHANLEVIVVDDGSTDETREVVARFTDPRVRYVWQQNAGLSAARNTGIREARFPFVAFLDADDLWLPAHLAEALAEFSQREPEFAVVACGSVRMDQDGVDLPTRLPAWKSAQEIPVAEIVTRTRFMPSSAVARRAAFDSCGGFDTSLRSSEDRDMWIRLGERYRIACRSSATVRVRKHPHNMSKHADRMRQSMHTVITRAYERGVVPQSRWAFWRRVWAMFHFQVAWMLHDEGRPREAVAAAVRALQCWPLPLAAGGLSEPPLFRLRALRTFLLAWLGRR